LDQIEVSILTNSTWWLTPPKMCCPPCYM